MLNKKQLKRQVATSSKAASLKSKIPLKKKEDLAKDRNFYFAVLNSNSNGTKSQMRFGYRLAKVSIDTYVNESFGNERPEIMFVAKKKITKEAAKNLKNALLKALKTNFGASVDKMAEKLKYVITVDSNKRSGLLNYLIDLFAKEKLSIYRAANSKYNNIGLYARHSSKSTTNENILAALIEVVVWGLTIYVTSL